MTADRIDPPFLGDERALLDSFLDYHRATLAMKCEGLTDAQLHQRSAPPSNLSLLGLVRHMAKVERIWFRRVMSGDHAGKRWLYSDDNWDADFDDVGTASVSEAFELWRAECDNARRVAAEAPLDATGALPRGGGDVSLRWVFIHMIEEYARHNGHADLLRERIDGAVGD